MRLAISCSVASDKLRSLDRPAFIALSIRKICMGPPSVSKFDDATRVSSSRSGLSQLWPRLIHSRVLFDLVLRVRIPSHAPMPPGITGSPLASHFNDVKSTSRSALRGNTPAAALERAALERYAL